MFHLQVFICMSNDGRGTDVSSVEDKSALSYTTDPLKPHGGRPENPLSASEESVTGKNSSDPLQGTNDLAGENITSQPIRAAKIHDFCFGIPFGEYPNYIGCSFFKIKVHLDHFLHPFFLRMNKFTTLLVLNPFFFLQIFVVCASEFVMALWH